VAAETVVLVATVAKGVIAVVEGILGLAPKDIGLGTAAVILGGIHGLELTAVSPAPVGIGHHQLGEQGFIAGIAGGLAEGEIALATPGAIDALGGHKRGGAHEYQGYELFHRLSPCQKIQHHPRQGGWSGMEWGLAYLRPLTCFIRRRFLAICRAVRTFFLPA